VDPDIQPARRPAVAIVGRPNVGKSTLFNRLLGRRVSIEDAMSGVTRDRVLHPLQLAGRTVDLVDTGGLGLVDRDDLSPAVHAQIEAAMQEADVLVFLVDCRAGVAPLDEEVAGRLRVLGKPVILAANKADMPSLDDERYAFHKLGLGEPLAVSAKANRGVGDLLARIGEALPPQAPEPADEQGLRRIAFVGKRNAGKSSLVNRLAGSDRVIVSDRPGTTRDSVDVIFERDGQRFVAIDTAGVRRRGRADDAVDFYGQVRSERAVRRADVVALVIDATTPVGRIDKRIARLAAEAYKPCVLTVNKWDLARAARPGLTAEAYGEYLLDRLPQLYYAPLAVTSAHTGENLWGLVRVCLQLADRACTQVGTGALNRALRAAVDAQAPPVSRGRALKLYYATQTQAPPPTFLVFCNDPRLVTDRYTRYLAGRLRQALGLEELPLSIQYRTSHERG